MATTILVIVAVLAVGLVASQLLRLRDWLGKSPVPGEAAETHDDGDDADR